MTWRRKIEINHVYDDANNIDGSYDFFSLHYFPPDISINADAIIKTNKMPKVSKINPNPKNQARIPTPNMPAKILIVWYPVRCTYKRLRYYFSGRYPNQPPNNRCLKFWQIVLFHIDFPVRHIRIGRLFWTHFPDMFSWSDFCDYHRHSKRYWIVQQQKCEKISKRNSLARVVR